MKHHILFVDDEPSFLQGLRRALRSQWGAWELFFATSAAEALEEVSRQHFDTIVTDVMMPEKDGLALLTDLSNNPYTRDIPVVILTGSGDKALKRKALDLGAADLMNKPVDTEELIARIRSVIRLKTYQDELRNLNRDLEQRVKERTFELEQSRMSVLLRLAKAGEYRDEGTGHHVVRVAWYCHVLADKLGMPEDFKRTLFLTSPLHDIGKIGVPDMILFKRGILTNEERMIMQRHCNIGAEILSGEPWGAPSFVELALDSLRNDLSPESNGLLKMASSIALTHHERWDGKGYPNGLTGDRIPMEGQIVTLADVYDALCSERPYKPAYPEDAAITMMRAESMMHFSPEVFRAFESSIKEFRSIRHQFADELIEAA